MAGDGLSAAGRGRKQVAIRSIQIEKRIPASLGNVIANYLDIEHLDFHSGLGGCQVVSETATAACLLIRSVFGPLQWRNLHFYEFRPPNVIINAIRSPVGPMVVQSEAEAQRTPDGRALTVVRVHARIDLVWWGRPFWPLLRAVLVKANRRILAEDLEILGARQQRFGDDVSGYLRSGQPLLFKDAFRRSFESDPHPRTAPREAPSDR